MKQRRVKLGPRAAKDVAQISMQIEAAAGALVAEQYVARLREFLRGFDIASERGHLREDLRPGLRITGFEGRITIAFHVHENHVEFLRCFRGGQNWEEKI